MKKIGILMVCIMLMASFTTAWAENKAGSFTFTPFIGGYVFEGNQNSKDAVAGGLRAGYNFTKNWGLEGFYAYVPSQFEDTGVTNSVYVGGIEGLYNFLPDGRFVPFVAIGVGAFHYSDGRTPGAPTNFAVDYGAGFKFYMTDNIALRADVRHVLPLNDRYNDLLCTLGIDFSFYPVGKEVVKTKVEESPAPVKEMVDSDHDGVPDDLDKCPGTLAGVAVDKDGCPLNSNQDSDKDGVPDYLDKCPETPASVVVDKDGCPPDSDKDGVPDYLDKCPGTLAGVAVDKDGCPLNSNQDSDHDGVPDYLDNCPGTPAGVAVDKDGCAPDPNLDSDHDGVPDYLDKCPGTPAGVAVDKNGCPLAEEKTISIRLKLEFDTNKAVIKKQYYKEIKKVADFMKEHYQATATIVGHTDDVEKSGKPKSSMLLSKARAISVRQYLIKKFGIKGSRITALGYGSDKPIASNKTKEGRQKNRRVVALFETVQER